MADFTYAYDLVKRQQNSATDPSNQTSSVSALLSTVIPTATVSILFLILFLAFRIRFPWMYEPRTFVGKFSEDEKTPMPKKTLFSWIRDFKALPDDFILNHQSLDSYLYLRYNKIIIFIFIAGSLMTWPILMPVNATASSPAPPAAPSTQFDVISYSNSIDSPNRYYAHALVAWLFFGMVLFVIARETLFFIHLRQAWLLAPQNATRMSSRTVLFTDVPTEYLSQEKLRKIFPSIMHIWIASDTKELADLVEDRDKTAMKLESAEIKLSQTVNAQRLKMRKKGIDFGDPLAWVDEKNRPAHRLKPLIGQKVDTIDWCREHLRTLIPEVEYMQTKHRDGKAGPFSACFIEFETVGAAESAYQQLVFHKPKIMQPRAIGMTPSEVIWDNLNKKWYFRDAMYVVTLALVVAMIIFWTPFTTFVGAITNINYLTQKVSFLRFINNLPRVILGLITGLLPSIILSVLMAIVPIFLQLIAKLTGCVTAGEIELHIQSWYYAFQVVQVFLVTTFASGAASVGAQIARNPGSAVTLLAQNLPKASNFYNSYVMFAGIGAFGSTLLNITGLALFIVLKKLIMKTPRKRYTQYLNIAGLGWGSTYPKTEIFACIAMSYAIITPLVMGFTVIGLVLFYFANRYLLIYVLDTSDISTRGATYPLALQHLMVGVYISQLCLIGLLAIETGSHAAAIGPLVIVIILLIVTILAHIAIRNALKPLSRSLPRDLLYASSPGRDTDSHLENGSSHYSSALSHVQDQASTTDAYTKENSQVDAEAVHSASWNQPGLKGRLLRITRPSWLPPLAPHLSVPLSEYSAEVRREAYLHPAITSPTPLLWIVHDDLGVSAREKQLTSKVIGVTDRGAFWNEKNKLMTVWEGQPYDKQDVLVRQAPIHEERILY